MVTCPSFVTGYIDFGLLLLESLNSRPLPPLTVPAPISAPISGQLLTGDPLSSSPTTFLASHRRKSTPFEPQTTLLLLNARPLPPFDSHHFSSHFRSSSDRRLTELLANDFWTAHCPRSFHPATAPARGIENPNWPESGAQFLGRGQWPDGTNEGFQSAVIRFANEVRAGEKQEISFARSSVSRRSEDGRKWELKWCESNGGSGRALRRSRVVSGSNGVDLRR
ncbi:hypothetical protein Fot_30523 [Forsythia ovata]|uniref:Uncharacterized protein n=1 Tax=Forsythia ovata TaxID=205694 RepID=A0ABD1TUZ0_9LAMI